MIIPVYTKQQWVNPQTGYLTDSLEIYQQQLNQQLKYSFSQSGLVVPSLTSSQIDNVTSNNNPNQKPDGTFFYNSETNEPQVKVNGVVKTIQTT